MSSDSGHARLARDFAFACRTLFKITNRRNRPVAFEFNRVQRVIHAYVERQVAAGQPVRLWILKGRQLGCSTYFSVRAAWHTFFHGENCLILAHLEGAGQAMFLKVERAYRNLPADLRGELDHAKSTARIGTVIQFGDPLDCVIKRESAEIVNSGVSETYQHAHLTEVPLWRDADATMHGFLPTIERAAGTSIVGEFTARGVGDYAHRMWVSSVAGDSGFEPLFLPWYWSEEYQRERRSDDAPLSREEREYRSWVREVGTAYPLDARGRFLDPAPAPGFELSIEQLLWRRDTIREFRGDIDKFRREFPACASEAFQTAGRKVIPPSVLDRMERRVVEPIKRGEFEVRDQGGRRHAFLTERDDGQVWVFASPERHHRYVIGADVATGQSRDYSAAQVIDATNQKKLRVVLSFQGKRTPGEFAKILRRLGKAYNGALLAPERNGPGVHVIDELLNRLDYASVGEIFRWSSLTTDSRREVGAHGFPTTRETKMPMVQKLAQACYDDALIVPCARTLAELRSFVYLDDLDKLAGADQGCHDDLVMALGVGVWAALDSVPYDDAATVTSDVVINEAVGY